MAWPKSYVSAVPPPSGAPARSLPPQGARDYGVAASASSGRASGVAVQRKALFATIHSNANLQPLFRFRAHRSRGRFSSRGRSSYAASNTCSVSASPGQPPPVLGHDLTIWNDVECVHCSLADPSNGLIPPR